MAKKKPGGKKGGGKGKGKGRPKRPAGETFDLPPPQMMEQFMRQMFGPRADAGGETPADQAQELVYSAMEEDDPQRQVERARQALALWPDCADAYTLLAENAPTRA